MLKFQKSIPKSKSKSNKSRKLKWIKKNLILRERNKRNKLTKWERMKWTRSELKRRYSNNDRKMFHLPIIQINVIEMKLTHLENKWYNYVTSWIKKRNTVNLKLIVWPGKSLIYARKTMSLEMKLPIMIRRCGNFVSRNLVKIKKFQKLIPNK